MVDRAVIRGFVPSWCPLSQMLMEKVWGWGGDAEGSGGTGQGGVGWGVSVSFLSHPSLGTLTVWLVLSLCFSRCIAKHLPFTLSKGRASAIGPS